MKTRENRLGASDRRTIDLGPPRGWQERRRHAERRMPETMEIEMSESEWQALFVQRPPKAAAPAPVFNEQADDIFTRQRK